MKNFIGLVLIELLIRHGSADVSHLSKHQKYNGYLPPQPAHNLFIEQDYNGINSPQFNNEVGQSQSHQSGYDNESRGYLPPYHEQGKLHNHQSYMQQEERGYLPPPTLSTQIQNNVYNQQRDENRGYASPSTPQRPQENPGNQNHQEDRGYLPPYHQEQLQGHNEQQQSDPNLEISYHNNYAISLPSHQVSHDQHKGSNSNEEYEDNSQGYNYSPPNHGFEDGATQQHHQGFSSNNVIGGIPQSSIGNLMTINQNIIQNQVQSQQEAPLQVNTKQNLGYVPPKDINLGYENEEQHQQVIQNYQESSSLSHEHGNTFTNKVQQKNTEPISSFQIQNNENYNQGEEQGYLPPIGALELPQSSDTLHIVPPSRLGLPIEQKQKQLQTNHINIPLPIPQVGYYFIPAVVTKLPSLAEGKTENLSSVSKSAVEQNQIQQQERPQQRQQQQEQQDQGEQHQKYYEQQHQQQQYQPQPQPQQQQHQNQQQAYQQQHQQQDQGEQQQEYQHQQQIQQQQYQQQQEPQQEQQELSSKEISPDAEYSRTSTSSEIRIIPSVQTAQDISSQGYLTPSQVVDQHIADIDITSPETNHLEFGQQNFPPLTETQQHQDHYAYQQQHQLVQNQNAVQNTHHQVDQPQVSFENFAKSAVLGVNNQQNQISSPLESVYNTHQENAYLQPFDDNVNQQQQAFHQQNQDQQVYSNIKPLEAQNQHNQVTNLEIYMASVNPSDRYGSLQFQPQQAIESNPPPVNPPIMFSKPSAIQAYAPGMAYKTSTNVPFSSFTQAGYLPSSPSSSGGNSRSEETQQEYSSSIGFELNEEAKNSLSQQRTFHDNTIFPVADILDGVQDDEMSQIMEQLQGHIRTIQITNHQDHSVKNIKVVDSSNQNGERTIEILGQSNENPMGEHKVLHVISKPPNPQPIHQTLKIFNDNKASVVPTIGVAGSPSVNNEYLPPSNSDTNVRKFRQTSRRRY